ncbi:hypothetical protein ACFLQQ_04755 [Actinomycetota bacterium]
MISKRILYIAIGILIFILVATICPDCASSGSYEELEWQKSKKVAEGMSEEEATKAAKEIVRKDEEEFEEYDDEPYDDGYDEEEYEEELKELEREEREKKEREEAAAEAELGEGFEEEEKLIPNDPITYYGDVQGVDVILVINFKTTEVSGSVSLSGDDYIDAAIDGVISIDTFEITSNFSGIMGSKEYGVSYPFNGTINGNISDDLKIFNGVLLDDEGGGGKFTGWTAYE